jgi:hypothetical protein
MMFLSVTRCGERADGSERAIRAAELAGRIGYKCVKIIA